MTNFIRSTQVGGITVEYYAEYGKVRLVVNGVKVDKLFRNIKSAHLYSVNEAMKGLAI